MVIRVLGCLLCLLLQCLALQVLLAQDQSEFISLDCGLEPENSSYRERSTTLTYISDANFVSSGEIHRIKSEYKSEFQEQLWALRSFPRGIRNCYNLNLTKRNRYLIKAAFLYGNYDGRDEAPEFDIYIGSNPWSTVSTMNASTGTQLELVHFLTTDRLQVCLVKTGTTTPFISSLEIRPVKNGTYVSQSGSLMRHWSFYIGSADDSGAFRFPEDVRDRSWIATFSNTWTRLTSASTIDTSTSGYDIPQRSLRGAAAPQNSSLPLTFSVPLPPDTLIYAYMHFAELEELKSNESRMFHVTYNGRPWLDDFSPSYLIGTSFFSPVTLGPTDGKYEFIIQKTENSTRPPIINALEIYVVLDLLQPETNERDVDAITHIKLAYGVNKDSWQGDPCSPQNFTWDGLGCSFNEDAPRITSLDLSGSGLRGQISQMISNLSQLTYIDLSNNTLTGGVPGYLAGLTALRVLNLSGNQLTGPIPVELAERTQRGSLILSIEGNPGLCGPDSCSNNKKKKKNTAVVPVVVSVVSLSVILALVLILLIRKKRARSSREGGALHMHPSFKTNERRFSYSDVLKMTNNFERVLGRGGFGAVYHGYLGNDQVAVKLLDETSSQGYKQFKAEVELLLRVHHKFLVSLVGYCDDRGNVALIYELMANRDLKEHLSGSHNANVLSWEERLRISSEVAQGLEYLHHGCKPPIIHRDVKTTNILLNQKFQAKLADFGLSRSFSTGSQSHISTVVAGTPGFLDPEYFRSNWLTEKSDVFSFGVVLWEIITNRPVIDQTRENAHLNDWVQFMLGEGDIRKIIDPKLGEDFGENSAWKLAEVALSCVSQSSSRRPSMTHVVMELNKCLAAEMARKRGSPEMEPDDSMVLLK